MDDEEDHEYNDGKYTLKEISAINIATDQYWSALLMVYGFLKKNELDEVVEINENIAHEINTLTIQYYRCLDCNSVYFPNPECGIEHGVTNDNNINNYKCYLCNEACETNGLIIFDENREKKRQLELEKIKTTEIKLNEEEKCPLCLEYLIVCEFDDECSKKERNIFLLCGHKMCRKCYYTHFQKLPSKKKVCPICRMQQV